MNQSPQNPNGELFSQALDFIEEVESSETPSVIGYLGLGVSFLLFAYLISDWIWLPDSFGGDSGSWVARAIGAVIAVFIILLLVLVGVLLMGFPALFTALPVCLLGILLLKQPRWGRYRWLTMAWFCSALAGGVGAIVYAWIAKSNDPNWPGIGGMFIAWGIAALVGVVCSIVFVPVATFIANRRPNAGLAEPPIETQAPPRIDGEGAGKIIRGARIMLAQQVAQFLPQSFFKALTPQRPLLVYGVVIPLLIAAHGVKIAQVDYGFVANASRYESAQWDSGGATYTSWDFRFFGCLLAAVALMAHSILYVNVYGRKASNTVSIVGMTIAVAALFGVIIHQILYH